MRSYKKSSMKLLATGTTLERLGKMISEYYGGSTISVHEDGDIMRIHNSNGPVKAPVEVVSYRNGFAFVRNQD